VDPRNLPASDADDKAKTVVLRRRGEASGGSTSVASAPRGSPLLPGAEVGGRYRIQRLLGMGGMARVWLADDLERKMPVAFKEMLVSRESSGAELEESALLFRREYYAMKKLAHPGTVKVFDCGVMETGNRYLTMEVVSGEDLCDIAARQPMPYRDVHRTLTRMAQILGFVHSRLIVHCDVKAENVRITAVGEVKLMDFGIMHPLGTRASGKVWGTPEYMAPEWHERGIIDGRSDLYSLGVLAFFLLTQTTPFRTQEIGATLADDLTEPARALAEQPNHHPELAAIVLRLLERDPRSRFANAAELVGALCAMSGETVDEEPLAARASYLHLPQVVGRQRETEELTGRLEAAKRGAARALLLGAPAGFGKSRLLQELELEAKSVDMPFALGQCRAEGLAARAPIEQALRALLPATPAPLLEPLRPVLGKLLPQLLRADVPAPAFRDAGEEKIAVFEALSRWLRGLAAVSPFVLCLEDLHWADSATLETMNAIIRALHGSRGQVLATFRSDELSRLSLAFQTVDELLADSIELAPLSEGDMESLVALALDGYRQVGPLARSLYEATGGNVFFATECLRALIEEGALQRRLGSWIAAPELAARKLPRSIKEVVLARLSTLSEESAAFFRRLAPAGRMLDMPLLQAIAEVGQAELFQVLDEGVERQFLQYVEGRYFFVHATVHEAIYESTPIEVRRRSHGRIAEHLLATSMAAAQAAMTADIIDAADATDAAGAADAAAIAAGSAGSSLATSGIAGEAAGAIGYHFARSDEPTRAIEPLLAAAARALENKALLEAFGLLEEAARLLEDNPRVPDREARLIAAWGLLVEVAYNSNTPACIRYAQKLFQHWDATAELARGQAEVRAELEEIAALAEAPRAAALAALFRERPLVEVTSAKDVFLKRAEYRILESIALAITGRTAEFAAGLARTAEDHPPASPYRAAAMVAIGGLTSHTGHFQGAVDEIRRHIGVLLEFTAEVPGCPRRLEWALGMGAYFMNMNLALSGRPLNERATAKGFEVAERLGFTDLRVYHLFSQIVRASFIGDGSTFQGPFAEMNELMRKLGNPRLPERNLTIYTPPYYLERGELELLRAVIQKGERMVKLLPGDRWLKLYVLVYRVCLQVATVEQGSTPPPELDSELEEALAATRASDFRMETLVWVYKARLELAVGRRDAAKESAACALARAIEPLRANPFDEILTRRVLAELAGSSAERKAELASALGLAEMTGNVLQVGIVRLAMAERGGGTDESANAGSTREHLEAAQAAFATARAERWQKRARALSEFAD
jgi:eukaryotic-like serine/threonine-protein kinase